MRLYHFTLSGHDALTIWHLEIWTGALELMQNVYKNLIPNVISTIEKSDDLIQMIKAYKATELQFKDCVDLLESIKSLGFDS